MGLSRPKPITPSERLARQRRVVQIARGLGFTGRVEYRHVDCRTGGARYGLAKSPQQDLLVVYAKAFERDADLDDFSLEAILAHERGHQLLARHGRLTRNLPGEWSGVTEEIVASLLGSLLVQEESDQQDLLLKALFEAANQGFPIEQATVFIMELRSLLEKIL